MLRAIVLVISFLVLTACAAQDEEMAAPLDLGNFTLGHNVVVAPRAATSAALSREASEEELTSALKSAIAERLDRYEGTRQYHLGVSVEGYILARGGVPVVASPKSALILQITVWDDEKGEKLNIPPDQLTVLEDIDGESIFGSGWLQTADGQLEELALNAAEVIENYLRDKNAERGWFESEEEAARRIEASEAAAAAEEAERQNEAPAARVKRPEAGTEVPEAENEPDIAESGA